MDVYNGTSAVPHQHRLVHLDLKGAPPKIDYYTKLFPVLHEWGATGILLEYEDMFPYWGELSPLRHEDAYSPSDINFIQKLAADNNLIIVPLVQTFGHLEYLLKHEKFQELREIEKYPNSVCPSHERSADTVLNMIQQIMELHPNVTFLHIGADEVWHLGVCDKCKHLMEKNAWGTSELYLSHVCRILTKISAQYPNVSAIMWDDMLRSIDTSVMTEYGLGQLVEPMVWFYQAQDSKFPYEVWEAYSSVFSSLWVASAWKGALESSAMVVAPIHYINNHRLWLRLLQPQVSRFRNFRGFALTGWQRFDHYAILCELIPAGLPTLALCLKILVNGHFTEQAHNQVSTLIKYNGLVPLMPPNLDDKILDNQMEFPGDEVHTEVLRIFILKEKCHALLESDGIKTWMCPWFIARNFTNPLHLQTLLPYLKGMLHDLEMAKERMGKKMDMMYYRSSINEWIGCHIEPYVSKLAELVAQANEQFNPSSA